ncbi:MAG: hypothetical protein U0R66_17570 [Mycobacterium sp.]|mgnify:CR=1 FL=1
MAVVPDGYTVHKRGRRWTLTYPDGGWQRIPTRREAARLAALHAEDYEAWRAEVQGGGALSRLGSED